MAGPSHKLPSGRAGLRPGASDTKASTPTHRNVPSTKPPVSFDRTWGPAVDTLGCPLRSGQGATPSHPLYGAGHQKAPGPRLGQGLAQH